MSRLRVVVMTAALALGSMAPAVAEARVEPAAWARGGLVDRLVAWGEGLLRVVAGSGTEQPAEDTAGVGLDGQELLDTRVEPLPGSEEAFPGYDPDG